MSKKRARSIDGMQFLVVEASGGPAVLSQPPGIGPVILLELAGFTSGSYERNAITVAVPVDLFESIVKAGPTQVMQARSLGVITPNSTPPESTA